MNKIPCASQNTDPKPCLLIFASLVALDSFHLLLINQLTGDLTPEWSGGCRFHPLSDIYAKTLFCCVETVVNNALNCRFWLTVRKHSSHFEHSFLKMMNTLPSDIFNSSAISCNFNLWSAKTSLWSFFVFYGTTGKIGWTDHSTLFVCVRPHLKSAYHL